MRVREATVEISMTIVPLDAAMSVCKVSDWLGVDLDAPLCFTGNTDEERSLICRTVDVPASATARDDGWRAFRVAGVLDFSLVGILARISTILADAGIGIVAVSTFNTDYILVKADNFPRALALLAGAGYTVAGVQAA